MDRLPAELIGLIVHPDNFLRSHERAGSWYDPEPYKQVRLISRAFNIAATPHLFSSVSHRSTEYSVSRLRSIASHPYAASGVKVYKYSFLPELRLENQRAEDEYYTLLTLPINVHIDADVLQMEVTQLDGERWDPIATFDEPVFPHLPLYKRIREFAESNELFSVHRSALASLPLLEEVGIAIDHTDMMNRPTLSTVPAFGHQNNKQPWGPTLFRAVMLALGERIEKQMNPVRKLQLDGLSKECLLLAPSSMAATRLTATKLRELRLQLTTVFGDASQVEYDGGMWTLWHRVAGKVLVMPSTELEVLHISLTPSRVATRKLKHISFNDLFTERTFRPDLVVATNNAVTPSDMEAVTFEHIVHFPKLREIRLSKVAFSVEQIISFLETHRRTLRHIELDHCILTSAASEKPLDSDTRVQEIEHRGMASWPRVFRRMHDLWPRLENGPPLLEELVLKNLVWVPGKWVEGLLYNVKLEGYTLGWWRDWVLGLRAKDPGVLGMTFTGYWMDEEAEAGETDGESSVAEDDESESDEDDDRSERTQEFPVPGGWVSDWDDDVDEMEDEG